MMIFGGMPTNKPSWSCALALRPDDLEVKVDRANVEIDWKANTWPVHHLIDEIRAKDPSAIQSVADILAFVRTGRARPCRGCECFGGAWRQQCRQLKK